VLSSPMPEGGRRAAIRCGGGVRRALAPADHPARMPATNAKAGIDLFATVPAETMAPLWMMTPGITKTLAPP